MKVFKGLKKAFKKTVSSKPKTIQWQGTFWNDGKQYPFAFEHMEITPNGTISGHGTDTKGQYVLTGNVNIQGTAYILKTRTKDPKTAKKKGKAMHQSGRGLGGFMIQNQGGVDRIEYNGTFEAGKLVGTWIIGEFIGEFEIELLSQKYIGEAVSSLGKESINWRLRFLSDRVWGYGKDSKGFFTVVGTPMFQQS
jgi:hypothetical protein